jgi:hypothetical protein
MLMSDLLYIALAAGFFAASIGLVYAFAGLRP